MQRSRGWIFVINNDTFDDLINLLKITFRYMEFAFEHYDEPDKTPHIQGFIYFDNAVTMSALKKSMPRAHLEAQKGSVKQNDIYISKETRPYKFGEKPTQGQCKMDRIELAMQDPMQDFHTYHIYRKSYKEAQRKNIEIHSRKLRIIDYKDRYKTAALHDTVSFDSSFDTYEDEQAIFVNAYCDKDNIVDWLNGYPPKIKRGYEIIMVNPSVIYVMYNTPKEYNYLVLKYSDNIDYDYC